MNFHFARKTTDEGVHRVSLEVSIRAEWGAYVGLCGIGLLASRPDWMIRVEVAKVAHERPDTTIAIIRGSIEIAVFDVLGGDLTAISAILSWATIRLRETRECGWPSLSARRRPGATRLAIVQLSRLSDSMRTSLH
jgi:hypothetical protein